MESSARGGEASGRKSRWFWWFLSGLVLGVLGAIFVPDLVRPYLPDMFKGENVEIAGVVEAKSREADRLLLTIGGDAGAVLVTYTHEIPEMDLLIEPGDSVVLAVREYAPFVEDPSVRRVQKSGTVRRAGPSASSEHGAASGVQRREVPAGSESRPERAGDPAADSNAGPEVAPGVVDRDSLPEMAAPLQDEGAPSAPADDEQDPRGES